MRKTARFKKYLKDKNLTEEEFNKLEDLALDNISYAIMAVATDMAEKEIGGARDDNH